ncbi:MAG TPA: response regulator transcription factor [Pseudomonadales bacterium]|nr:response regulator transcription factor [Pseudomonadales bacterium]
MLDRESITLLVVEDDLQLRTLYARSFRHLGVQVLTAAGLLDARGILAATRPTAVILDLSLENESGLQLLAELPDDCVVVVVTGSRGQDLVLDVLSAGAADLVFKPFAMEELTSRVLGRIVARRRVLPAATTEACAHLDADARRLDCAQSDSSVRLSRQELSALLLLMDAEGDVVSREALSRGAQGQPWDPDSRRVDALVSRVRRKLACARCGLHRELTAVHSNGYRFGGTIRR